MLKAELMAELVAASERLDAGPITKRMIEDWIAERLLEGPRPKGNRRGLPPTWVYSEETIQRAVRIVELRAKGIRRTSALRVNLWIDGFTLPFNDMQRALRSEFKRGLAGLWRQKPWRFDARYRRKFSDREAKKIDPVDPDLAAAGFAPSMESLLRSGSEMFWGSSDQGPLQSSIANFLAEATSQSGIQFFPPAGLAGNPEETGRSGLSALERITQSDLIEGTKALLNFYEVMAFFFAMVSAPNPLQGYALSIVGDSPAIPRPLEKVVRSLDEHEWRVAMLAWMVVAAARSREAGEDGNAWQRTIGDRKT
jgi:hypothetical protein